MDESTENVNLDQPPMASYSDHVIIRYSEFSINFEFSQQVPPKSNGPSTPICLGRIVMSPEHAKMFNQLMSSIITEYEKNFHEISLKTNLTTNLK